MTTNDAVDAPRTGRVLRRAAAALGSLGLVGSAVARATWAAVDSTGGVLHRPDTLLTVVVGGGALVGLALLATCVLRVTVAVVLTGRRPPAGEASAADAASAGRTVFLGPVDRVVAGLLIGAGGLAPQAAGASTVTAATAPRVPAVRVLADAVRSVVPASETEPVDPTYLGPTVPAAPPATAPSSAAPTPTATPHAPAPPPSHAPAAREREGRTVVVRPGDTLWAIATRVAGTGPERRTDDAAVARTVHALYAQNRAAIGDDPDLIRPGTRLVVAPQHDQGAAR